MAWHDATCAGLDLEWEDGRPGCRTCERRAPELTPVHPLSPPAPPPDTPRSELVCTWPPGLFSQPEEEEEDVELLALIRANIDEWTGTTSTRDVQTALQSTQQSSQQQPLDQDELAASFGDIYSRLPNADSIRLLRLHGSKTTSDAIHCTLEIFRLHDPCRPIFEAFSYTWADSQGDSSLCKTIFLGPHYDILPVTTNCLAALRRFRTVFDRLVWVDAICINQFDLEERGHQVSLMRDIYTSAARVLTYLGDSICKMENAAVLPPKNGRDLGDSSQDPTVDSRTVLQVPYFSRIWVIQELLLSRTATITFGNHTMHWKDLLSNVKTSPSIIGTKPSGNWVEHFASEGGDQALCSLLVATKNCRCGDLRDRVYGLMGLITEGQRGNLPVDYSISVQQLYTGLAMYWLASGGEDWVPEPFYVLSLALLPKITPFLPSWVPDWAPQPDIDTNRGDPSSVPLTFQFDTTFIERPSAGFDWSNFSGRQKAQVGWTLDHEFWDCILSASGIHYKDLWDDRAKHAGWQPGASIKSLPQSVALILDAVHILSASMGDINLTDIEGKPLHGLQLIDSGESEPGGWTRLHNTDLHVLLDWKAPFALKNHGNEVFSLNSSFRVVFAPLAAPVPPSHLGVQEMYESMQSLEIVIVQQWSMDLFCYGVCAGRAYANSPRGEEIQQYWSKSFPLSSAACQVFTFSSDNSSEEAYCDSMTAAMMKIREDVMDFASHNTEPQSREANTPRWTLGLPAHVNEVIAGTGDATFAARIQQAHATRQQAVSSLQESCTYLSNVVQRHRRSCKNYAPLKRALFDSSDDVSKLSLSLITLGPGLQGLMYPIEDEFDRPLQAPHGGTVRVYMTRGQIIHRAWALLQDLRIDPKFTLEQNLNILWIHVVTMEMVVRLRGVLQQRLILKAIGDKMRKVQKICLI